MKKYIESVLYPPSSIKQQQEKQQQEQQQQAQRLPEHDGDDHHLVYSIQQSGEFYAAYKWYPFHNANLLLKTSTHSSSSHGDAVGGFVWDIQNVKILTFPHNILQTYIDGVGSITTKFYGTLPLLQIEEEEPYYLFYVAFHIPYNPTSLLFTPPREEEDELRHLEQEEGGHQYHHHGYGTQSTPSSPSSSVTKIRFIWDNTTTASGNDYDDSSVASSSSEDVVTIVKAQMEIVVTTDGCGDGTNNAATTAQSLVLFDVEFKFVLLEGYDTAYKHDKTNDDEPNLPLWVLHSIKVIDPTKQILPQSWQVKYSDYNNDSSRSSRSRNNNMILSSNPPTRSPSSSPRGTLIPQLLPSTIEIGKFVGGQHASSDDDHDNDSSVKLHLKLRNQRFQLIEN